MLFLPQLTFHPPLPLDPPIVSFSPQIRLPRNVIKNREGAPLPPPDSRVKLQLVMDEVGSDYINAR